MPTSVELLGYVAACLTTFAFLPQVLRIWRLRSARDVSLPTFLLLTTGVMLWLVYGLLDSDWPLVAANGVTLVLTAAILAMKLRFG